MRISDWSSDVCSSDLLATFHFVAADTADQRADVVAGLTLIEELAEHFDAGDDGLAGVVNADDLDFLTDLDDAGFDTARNDGAATRDREHVFDRHQERPVERTLRLWDPAVDSSHQLQDSVMADLGGLALKCSDGRTGDDRAVGTVEVVLRQTGRAPGRERVGQ